MWATDERYIRKSDNMRAFVKKALDAELARWEGLIKHLASERLAMQREDTIKLFLKIFS